MNERNLNKPGKEFSAQTFPQELLQNNLYVSYIWNSDGTLVVSIFSGSEIGKDISHKMATGHDLRIETGA